ncbi:MAG TPA: PGF-pre-PGF domain-containing protein, partial [candidate division Zixibacteria bacterium]|nr:PGF-pre-PGF domain-containing protein [candidate division Zixibacteria bacterium]
GTVEQYDSALPPIIVIQPVDQKVAAGQSATFSVSATGKLPLSYQWKKNGVAIFGATGPSYTTPSSNASDNGSTFNVVVTNSMGSVASNAAILTVTSSTSNQIVLLDVTHNHTTTVSNNPVSGSGKAFSFFNLTSWIPNNLVSPVNYAQGTLYQRLQVISKPTTRNVKYQLCVFQDQIIPEKHACTDRSRLSFNSPGTYYADQPMTSLYQYGNISWNRSLRIEMLVVSDGSGFPIDDRYGWNGTWDGSPDFTLYYPMQVRYTAIIVPPGGGTPVWPGEQISPSITTQPLSQTVNEGQNATFSVAASGSGPLTYQWQKKGVTITGATGATYTTPATTLADNGATFRAVVSNSAGSVTSNNATLTVNPVPIAPIITTQPLSQTVNEGQPATFSVAATGTAPLTFQWQKNNVNITGATGATYTTPATTPTDNGATFRAVVSNSAGSVTSNNATLTVNPAPIAPSITTQPLSQTVNEGQTATFSVVATGTAPLAYQWQKDGVAISGATGTTYTTLATTLADNGTNFSVNVSNAAGSVTSNNAILTVNPAPIAPIITTQPSSQTVNEGQPAIFSVVATGTEPLAYQWLKNGTEIQGATGATYTTPATTLADNGSTFRVNVSNAVGRVTSNSATLMISLPLPLLITIISPADNSINNTGNINVTVTLNRAGTAILNWEGMNESMIGQGTSFYRNKTGLLSGNYNFKIYANDSNGGFNISEPRNLIVDRKKTTSLVNVINTSTFIINSTLSIISPGGNATITIFNRTNASVNNSPLPLISIDSLARINSTLAVNLGSDRLIGENITLGPEGAIFIPDIQIRLNYSGSQLTSAGISSASQLRIKFYNKVTNTWEVLSPYTLYPNGSDGYLIANASHFSAFALIGIPTPPGGSTPASSSGSGGGGGGGGGGTSGENFSNIEVKEKYDLHIFKDKVTSYIFTNSRNPIMFIKITGNFNAGEINTAVEVLKNTSSLVKTPAPGKVYKNANVWVGTSGFANPKNIKIAVIEFKVPNTWLENNNVDASEIKLVRWNGISWITLDTSIKSKESADTFFEATTDSFSPVAITALIEPVSTAKPQITPLPGITATDTPVINDIMPSEGALPVNLSIVIAVFAVIGVAIAVHFKNKKG